MKLFKFILLIIIIFSKNTYASNLIYDSSFYEISINGQNISENKINEISKIKYISFKNILNNILDNYNFKKIKRNVDLNSKLNSLIQNINIEDEFISSNKYSAKIRINFDENQIIKLLRNNNINYSDLYSNNILIVSYEESEISKEGLSSNNTFYKNFNIKSTGLLNFSYPDLSPNDRFLIPYNKIKKNNLENLSEISNKYNSEYIVVIQNIYNNINNNFSINIYSSNFNKIVDTFKFKIDKNLSYNNTIVELIDEWWKNLYQIDNSKINKVMCTIINSNIHELQYIKSTINQISQTKSIKLKTIDFKKNLYEFIYFGDSSILSLKFNKLNISYINDNNNKCIIFIDNK